jgi:hypothetical protein
MTDRCVHEMLPGQCSYCVDIPFGITETIFITALGRAFHIWENCEYLESGQQFAVSRGGVAGEIFQKTWRAVADTHYPCEWCCALFYSKGINLEECMISDPNGEKPGRIVKSRYLGRNMKEFQIYYPETGELEILSNRYVKRFK